MILMLLFYDDLTVSQCWCGFFNIVDDFSRLLHLLGSWWLGSLQFIIIKDDSGV